MKSLLTCNWQFCTICQIKGLLRGWDKRRNTLPCWTLTILNFCHGSKIPTIGVLLLKIKVVCRRNTLPCSTRWSWGKPRCKCWRNNSGERCKPNSQLFVVVVLCFCTTPKMKDLFKSVKSCQQHWVLKSTSEGVNDRTHLKWYQGNLHVFKKWNFILHQ